MKRRAKDPDKYSCNQELAGFEDYHEDAELRLANGNKCNDGAITKRENAIDALIAQEYFAHLELYGGGAGTARNGALIYVPFAEQEWLERYAVRLPPLGVPVHAAPPIHVPMMTYARLLS